MSDVQVSNARRVVFTAMALVTFWGAAWRVYWLGGDEVLLRPERMHEMSFEAGYWTWRFMFAPGSLAIIPACLLSLASHNSPFRFRDRWVVVSSTLILSTGLILYQIGEFDERSRTYSWLILLPLILTTAFVIYGAWRRAVRDAEAADVEARDELS